MHALFLETTIVRSLSNEEGICQTGRNRLTIALQIKRFGFEFGEPDLTVPFLSRRYIYMYILQHARNEITIRGVRRCTLASVRRSGFVIRRLRADREAGAYCHFS